MARAMVLACVAAVVVAGLSVAAAEPVALQKAAEYPHAGIALAVPVGFAPQPLASPFDVMNAVIMDKDKPAHAVTLLAFPVAEQVAADEFADAKMNELKKNLAIRHLKALKKVPISVAGILGTARTMTYTFRGAKSVAAQVYFLREASGVKGRICYLLTVVSAAEKDKQARLLPTLGAVIKSVRLVAVQRPGSPDAKSLAEAVSDPLLGYSIRRPRGWYAAKSAMGVEMGQADYLAGGMPMPSVQLLIVPGTADGPNPEVCAKKFLGMARSVAAERKQATRVVSQGPTKLGNLPAYQFVLAQTSAKPPVPAQGEKLPTSAMIIQRTACLATPPGEARKVALLILTYRGDDVEAAEKLMVTLADGVTISTPGAQPTTQPTTAPAGKAKATTAPGAGSKAAEK